MSPQEREEWRKKQLEAKQARDAEQKVVWQEASAKAKKLWGIAKPATAGVGDGADAGPPTGAHPYLLAKRVKPWGVKVLYDALVVPLRNASWAITSLQFIKADGTKRFLTGGDTAGGYFMIGKPNGTLLICEGLSLYEATGFAVVVAFSATNLAAVAKVIREKKPDDTIIICADNDVKKEVNVGLIKAEEAAG